MWKCLLVLQYSVTFLSSSTSFSWRSCWYYITAAFLACPLFLCSLSNLLPPLFLIAIACICVCVCISVNMTCWVHMLFFLCVFTGLVTWHWTTITLLFLGEDHFFHTLFYSLDSSTLYRIEASLAFTNLVCQSCSVIWVVMLVRVCGKSFWGYWRHNLTTNSLILWFLYSLCGHIQNVPWCSDAGLFCGFIH